MSNIRGNLYSVLSSTKFSSFCHFFCILSVNLNKTDKRIQQFFTDCQTAGIHYLSIVITLYLPRWPDFDLEVSVSDWMSEV